MPIARLVLLASLAGSCAGLSEQSGPPDPPASPASVPLVLENVRAQAGPLAGRLAHLLDLPIVGDVRGAGFFWAMELVKDDDNARFDQAERNELLRSFLPRRLREAGLIARCDDRGDAVLQIAPPLISDGDLLDDIVARLTDVLRDAGKHMA